MLFFFFRMFWLGDELKTAQRFDDDDEEEQKETHIHNKNSWDHPPTEIVVALPDAC